MRKKSDRETDNEIAEALELANKVISFYEEVITTHAERIVCLEDENKKIQSLMTSSKERIDAALGTLKTTLIH